MATKKFKTEVTDLLQLIIHSLYSNREIFLRELISNASDAIDKLKYMSLVDGSLKGFSFDPRIDISFTEDGKRTLTIKDNGIGMNEEDLNNNLGTIASSGTRKFLSSLTDEQKKDSNLIGQFGVGFYSAFMVADKIEVLSRKAGEEKAYRWVSDGKSSYEIEEAERDEQGTTIILHLTEDGYTYANRYEIESLVKKYSDHIAYPIYLEYDKVNYNYEKKDEKGEPEKTSEHVVEQINTCSALWRRAKNEIKEEEYKEFYKNNYYDSEDPLFYIHTKAEGTTEYITLFYIPQKAPFDMNYADYRPGVKLYVKRVYITDDDKTLLPTYLRFVRGIIDSEDLPLNVSREILQENRVMASIRNSSVKKLLSEFKRYGSSRWWNYGPSSAESRLPEQRYEISEAFPEYHGVGYYVYDAISNWMVYHFHDTSSSAPMRRYCDIVDNKRLRGNASNIAPFLLNLREKQSGEYGEVRDAIKLVLPFFDDFLLEPVEMGDETKVRLTWKQKGSDFPMQPYHLSDGSMRFICLATALLQPDPPSTIVIDEPELGLHPAAISILAELLQAASKRMQVIVATQSPMLIDQFSIGDIIVMNREDGASTMKRLDPEEFSVWLEDYSVGELWTKNVIDGGPQNE